MRKVNLLLCFVLTIIFLSSCSEGDREEIVEMTIYEETGYATFLFSSDIFGEFLLYSEDGQEGKGYLGCGKSIYSDMDYKKGFEYKVKLKKTTLKEPLMDASGIRYEFIKILSKKKVITQNSEEQIEMEIAPKRIGFLPISQEEVQQVLLVKENGADDMKPLIGIEGFNYEEGYKYKLSVKKMIQAEPYQVKYVLLDILSKEQVE